MKPPLRFAIAYDLRNPPESGMSNPELYAATLEQMVWLDELGLDAVWFTEHHFVEDGYLPSWLPLASAAAGQTQRLRFSTDICLLPFNHPIRLAEDLAVLDNLSNGRVEIGAGMGYAPHEFRGFGVPFSRRVSLMDEGLEVLRLCFGGERFSFHGKRYQFKDVKISPGYVQPGGPPLWIAAMSAAGARRAARFDGGLLPQGPREQVLDPWREALRATNRDPDSYRVGIIRGILVTDDADRDWPMVRASERYRMKLYQRFAEESGEGLNAGERIPQTWIVGDADHCIRELCDFIRDYGVTDIATWGAPPGLRPEQLNQSLEQLAQRVIPGVRHQLEAAP